MLLTKEVEIKCVNNSKKYYIEKGYNWESKGSMMINIKDLPDGSHAFVECLCDYCFEEGIETIIEKPYYKYLNARNINPKDCCDKCKGKKNKEIILSKEDRFHYDYETVYKDFLNNNKILQTKEYLKVTDQLPYICINHKDIGIQYMSYSDLLRNHKECSSCKKDKMKISGLLSKESIKEIINNNNLILVSDLDNYEGMKYSLEVMCKNHMDKGVQSITLQQIIFGKYSCKYCYKDTIKGQNSKYWNGGVTTLQIFLRNTINNWKKESMRIYNYKCAITGQKFHNVHHLYGFDNIFKDFIQQYKVNIYTNINDYTFEELELYEDNFKDFHNKYGLGVSLHKDIHKLFHKIYGNKNNLIDQFEDFKYRLKSGEFDSFLKENNLNLII